MQHLLNQGTSAGSLLAPGPRAQRLSSMCVCLEDSAPERTWEQQAQDPAG